MTEFNDWYAKTAPNVCGLCHGYKIEDLRDAYEAGAASQAGTLRDKFAMAALAGLTEDRRLTEMDRADWSYRMADAMLEARAVIKTPEGGK
jgi:hypothetical protein